MAQWCASQPQTVRRLSSCGFGAGLGCEEHAGGRVKQGFRRDMNQSDFTAASTSLT